MSSQLLTVNLPHVVHETIDGETILIHLGTGTYYSLDGSGAEVWELLTAGTDADGVLASIRMRYEEDPEQVVEPVRVLLAELLAEELIVNAQPDQPADASPEGQTGATTGPSSSSSVTEHATGGSFAPPVLRKYTDMQEFMLADPLHDVEQEAGWPRLKDG